MLDSLSPQRRRLVLLLLLAVLVGTVVAVAVVVVRLTQDRSTAVAQEEPGPVLLVSGYGGVTSALAPLRSALAAAGRDVVVVPAVGDGTGDIGQQAERLDDQAQAAMDRFDASSVDVVGYSAGGVVARSWVRDHGGLSVARRVVGIGSPQHGTTVADLAGGLAGCPAACRQLRTDSGLLRALNAGDETPAGPVFVSVWSTSDDVVVPVDSARLSGAALNLTVQSVCPQDRAGHGDLPSDPVVLALLRTALGADPEKAPSSSVCPPDAG